MRLVPPIKLWGNPLEGHFMVLECICGEAVNYPGHPEAKSTVTCDRCGEEWRVVPATELVEQ